jgi:hypothetical protein
MTRSPKCFFFLCVPIELLSAFLIVPDRVSSSTNLILDLISLITLGLIGNNKNNLTTKQDLTFMAKSLKGLAGLYT